MIMASEMADIRSYVKNPICDVLVEEDKRQLVLRVKYANGDNWLYEVDIDDILCTRLIESKADSQRTCIKINFSAKKKHLFYFYV
jgi:hypothetical protein